jgi:hypothetical protein
MSLSDDLALKLEWYEIRDFLLGQNYKKRDVRRALELASTCRHPDAQWLTSVCAGKDVKTKQEAKAVFLALDDVRALCFAALVDKKNVDLPRLRRSAEMGFAFAQTWMSFYTDDFEHFIFASRAAAQGERDGFYLIGVCYEKAVGCEKDLEKARENYLFAARMDHVDAMESYGLRLNEEDPQRWHWWGHAATRKVPGNFLDFFVITVHDFDRNPSLAPVVFMIGRALRGHIDAEKRHMFGYNMCFDSTIGLANQAVEFFTAQCAAARKAVDTWCLMAVRINSKVNRDIRKKIGMMIWELREQADYAGSGPDRERKRCRTTLVRVYIDRRR